jgi:hypothetical protein
MRDLYSLEHCTFGRISHNPCPLPPVILIRFNTPERAAARAKQLACLDGLVSALVSRGSRGSSEGLSLFSIGSKKWWAIQDLNL